MYLGVKWEDSRIRNVNQTVEDLQVLNHGDVDRYGHYFYCTVDCFEKVEKSLFWKTSFQGVGFSFLSLLWQPDVEIHHVKSIKEPKVIGIMVTPYQIISKGAVIVMMVKVTFRNDNHVHSKCGV